MCTEPVACRPITKCGTIVCTGSCPSAAVLYGYTAGKVPATCESCKKTFPRPEVTLSDPSPAGSEGIRGNRSRNSSPAMSWKSSGVSWSGLPCSMIRKIHDVEERGEERSVHIDGRDALTRDMDVLVMIQAFCVSCSALWCSREGSVFIGPCSSCRSDHPCTRVVTHACVEVEARLAFSFPFNVRGTFRPKRRRAR